MTEDATEYELIYKKPLIKCLAQSRMQVDISQYNYYKALAPKESKFDPDSAFELAENSLTIPVLCDNQFSFLYSDISQDSVLR